ncbi:helix-turn-helix transcriptional regulator [Acrocarpospora sp. B8E8]|uniref:helix-turn-helix domain-containing protein n=1 Tax=Acrocarpospora sp. B8E8 TaxID=3153572 RepID=UPI00325C4BBB
MGSQLQPAVFADLLGRGWDAGRRGQCSGRGVVWGQVVQSQETDRFAAQIRALKDRAGISFEELARRTGISSSSLHRYCSGTKVPAGYGVVHTIAKACGARSEELRELHRQWALADATRSSVTSDELPAAVPGDDQSATSPTASWGAPEPARWSHRRSITILSIVCLTAITASVIAVLRAHPPDNSKAGNDPPTNARAAIPVRVFNVEERCRKRSDRAPGCSIGLAINPRLNYDAHNVVNHRVWHNDVLDADCVLHDGDEVFDEIGTKGTRWYRVRLGDVPGGHAWLSGIRTRDTPALPICAP